MAIVRYPSEFQANANTDYLEIKMIRRSYGSETNKYEMAKDYAGADTVVLNMPQKVTESIGQNWRNTTLGEAGRFLTPNQIKANGGMDFTGSLIKRLVEQFVLNTATTNLGKVGASNLSENGILSATSGIVYNPMMEVLYDGPDFRQFNFQFVLFTKSQKDAENIFKIVRFFQYSSVPSNTDATSNKQGLSSVLYTSTATGFYEDVGKTAGQGVQDLIGGILDPKKNPLKIFKGTIDQAIAGLGNGITGLAGAGLAGAGAIFTGDNRFIRQPPFLLLKFRRGSGNNPYILPLHPCALNSMNIDYTPSGNYTVINDFGTEEKATVVATTITLSLTEIKNVFASDYDDKFANTAPGV
jgi:hypothetical protein